MSWYDGRECPMGDPAEGADDPYADERAEYYASLAEDECDTEAAMRAADELVESFDNDCDDEGPIEPSDYTPEIDLRDTWSPSERGALTRALRPLGATITELSDVLELLGRPRLSRCETTARSAGHHVLRTARGAAALEQVRRERGEALGLYKALPLGERRRIREALGLRAAPSRWRLPELRAAVAMARRAA